MAHHRARRAALAAFLCALAFAVAARAESFAARVVSVADGDTLTVADGAQRQYRVRLSGIDAPERRQRFGAIARRSLVELAYRRTAVVDYYKTDVYGRLVGKVTVEGRDVNLEQLRRGMAWQGRDAMELSLADRLLYSQAAGEAQLARRGLWREAAVPPWEFRKHEKNEALHRGQ